MRERERKRERERENAGVCGSVLAHGYVFERER